MMTMFMTAPIFHSQPHIRGTVVKLSRPMEPSLAPLRRAPPVWGQLVICILYCPLLSSPLQSCRSARTLCHTSSATQACWCCLHMAAALSVQCLVHTGALLFCLMSLNNLLLLWLRGLVTVDQSACPHVDLQKHEGFGSLLLWPAFRDVGGG